MRERSTTARDARQIFDVAVHVYPRVGPMRRWMGFLPFVSHANVLCSSARSCQSACAWRASVHVITRLLDFNHVPVKRS